MNEVEKKISEIMGAECKILNDGMGLSVVVDNCLIIHDRLLDTTWKLVDNLKKALLFQQKHCLTTAKVCTILELMLGYNKHITKNQKPNTLIRFYI